MGTKPSKLSSLVQHDQKIYQGTSSLPSVPKYTSSYSCYSGRKAKEWKPSLQGCTSAQGREIYFVSGTQSTRPSACRALTDQRDTIPSPMEKLEQGVERSISCLASTSESLVGVPTLRAEVGTRERGESFPYSNKNFKMASMMIIQNTDKTKC